jgi:3-oxoacyl-[acyl-carrier-protein] synthase-3
MGAVIRGIGIWHPEQVMTNADIAGLVDTSDEWITTRTGIRQRHILPKDSPLKASDFGAAAALRALEKAGVRPDEVDAIICGAANPDKAFPATACFIQAKIGARNAMAYDVTAACAGFIFGVNQAALLIDSGQCRNVVVVGAEILSQVVDWSDRNTCILFGDAAGAVVMGKGPEGRGVILSKLRSDGTLADILFLDLPGKDTVRGMCMDGKQVFKAAVTVISEIVTETLAQAGFRPGDLDLLVMHQANTRILAAVAEKLQLPMEKVIVNVDRFGNTSSASVPLALADAEAQGRLKPGALVALAGVGGGMSWGCNLLRW